MVAQVDKLAAGIVDTRAYQALWIVLVFREELDDGGGERRAAHEDHAADLRSAHERHDAAGDGLVPTVILSFLIGFILSSAFPAILVYAQESR